MTDLACKISPSNIKCDHSFKPHLHMVSTSAWSNSISQGHLHPILTPISTINHLWLDCFWEVSEQAILHCCLRNIQMHLKCTFFVRILLCSVIFNISTVCWCPHTLSMYSSIFLSVQSQTVLYIKAYIALLKWRHWWRSVSRQNFVFIVK